MKDYNRFMPVGSIVRYTELKVFNAEQPHFKTCLLIHYTDNTMPTDCSPHRILEVVVNHGTEWDGMKVNSYRDGGL